ncbi:MAG: non-heme iron oxygenase ferredoxin subunit [Candidatus Eisenbacteria bacterium]|nr:non-heme iron oxygenase ferredoxin subunit [Candidatus Eisenbacteria bacterium]MCC7143098.1 non-heme iron oxygenase ferredoxin subunit [Candidatus Eisenbacteria bacterium]
MAEWSVVCKASEVPSGTLKQCELPDGTPVCVAQVDGRFLAIGGECTHSGAPLGEGDLEGTCVVCPWHGATFDLETGEARTPPAHDPVEAYRVQVVGDEVQVRRA